MLQVVFRMQYVSRQLIDIYSEINEKQQQFSKFLG